MIIPRAPQRLDPRYIGDAYGLKVSRLLYASLVTIDPISLEPIPDLADRVAQVSPLRYDVRLRPGLRFSDGSPLEATDVAETFEALKSDRVKSRYARNYKRIKSIEVRDPLRLSFVLESPHATFLTDLEFPVLRRDQAWVPGQDEDAQRLPELVGAGPYRLVALGAGMLELAANERWHGGRPSHPRVRLLVIRDDNTRALRLRAGAGDLALNAIPPLLVPLFEGKPDFEVRSAPGIGTTYLGFNTSRPPMNDLRVRQAVAHAIDRETLIRVKFGGRARLATSWIVPGHWAHDSETRRYRFDPQRARALLDMAGLAPDMEGVRLRLLLRTGSERFAVSVARALVGMLRDVGIVVDVRPSETASLLADLNRGRFQITMLQVPEVIEPHVLSWFFASDRIPGPGRAGGANRWRLRSPALDAALERGRALSGREARVSAYREVQRILAEQLPVAPLWHEDVVAVVGAAARGFQVPRDGRFGTLAR